MKLAKLVLLRRYMCICTRASFAKSGTNAHTDVAHNHDKDITSLRF